jgi:hypothetical protein
MMSPSIRKWRSETRLRFWAKKADRRRSESPAHSNDPSSTETEKLMLAGRVATPRWAKRAARFG